MSKSWEVFLWQRLLSPLSITSSDRGRDRLWLPLRERFPLASTSTQLPLCLTGICLGLFLLSIYFVAPWESRIACAWVYIANYYLFLKDEKTGPRRHCGTVCETCSWESWKPLPPASSKRPKLLDRGRALRAHRTSLRMAGQQQLLPFVCERLLLSYYREARVGWKKPKHLI